MDKSMIHLRESSREEWSRPVKDEAKVKAPCMDMCQRRRRAYKVQICNWPVESRVSPLHVRYRIMRYSCTVQQQLDSEHDVHTWLLTKLTMKPGGQFFSGLLAAALQIKAEWENTVIYSFKGSIMFIPACLLFHCSSYPFCESLHFYLCFISLALF